MKHYKYVVIKKDDIYQYLTDEELDTLGCILAKIEYCREREGKKANEYLIVNTDEKYSREVKGVLRSHGVDIFGE